MSRVVLFYNCLVKFLLVDARIAFNLINKDWKQYESDCLIMHACVYACMPLPYIAQIACGPSIRGGPFLTIKCAAMAIAL